MTPVAEEILQRAAPLFEAKGYRGTSMSELAAACELTKPTLYHHFRDKEALFLALLERGLGALEAALEPVERSPDPCLESLAALLLDPPESARLAMRLAGQDLSHLSQEGRDRFGSEYRRRFPSRIAALIARRELRPGVDPSFAATALLGLCAAFQRRNSPSRDLPAQIASLLAQGIVAAP